MNRFEGKPVYSVSEIVDLDFDLIFIANQYYPTLDETLALGIPEEKIFIVYQNLYEEYRLRCPHGKIRAAFFVESSQDI